MAGLRANARKVVCVGRNYSDHIKELNHVRPKEPFFFLKPPSSILPHGAGPILKPKGVILHHEVELALVMGKTLRDFNLDDEQGGLNAIKGYAVGIDMTARNIQEQAMRKGLPWDIAKGFDTFLPISNMILKKRIPDPHSVQLYLNVNGQVRQDDSTNLMLFKIPHLLSSITQVMTLEEDDLVLTGTPKGVGSVNPGDIIQAGVRVDGVEIVEGRLEVEVQQRSGPYQYNRE